MGTCQSEGFEAKEKRPRGRPRRGRKQVGIKLPEDTLERLRERSRTTKVPMGDLIEKLIEKGEREDERIRREHPDMPAHERLSHNIYYVKSSQNKSQHPTPHARRPTP